MVGKGARRRIPVKVLKDWLEQNASLCAALSQSVHDVIEHGDVLGLRHRPVVGAGLRHDEELLWRHLVGGTLLQVRLREH